MKTGFVYIWRDRKRNMYYIGSHWGAEDDGYICSSNRMRDAYNRRPKDFKRRILNSGLTTKQSLRESEHIWLKKAEKNKDRYYNHKFFSINSFWSWESLKFSEEHKKNIGKISKGKHWYTNGTENVFCFEELKPNNYFKGRTFSESHKRKVSIGITGKILSEEHKKNISLGRIGKKFSEQHKQNLRIGIQNAWNKKREV